MNRKQVKYLLVVFLTVIYVLSACQTTDDITPEPTLSEDKSFAETPPPSPVTDLNPYISITYCRENLDNESTWEQVFYIYDLTTKRLREVYSVPYFASYATGVVSLQNSMVYYSARETIDSNDRIYAYDMKSGLTTVLEDENGSYNEITMLDKNTLLTVAVTNRHTITPAIFNLSDGTFTYTADVNNEPFELYTGFADWSNYNPKYDKFIYVFANQEEMYNPDYLDPTSGIAIDCHIALMSADLLKKEDDIFTIRLESCSEIDWVTQVSEREFLVQMSEWVDLWWELDCEPYRYEQYSLVMDRENSAFTRIDTPFPNVYLVRDCITLDGGKTFYCYGYLNKTDTEHSFFIYDCTNGEITTIIRGETDGTGGRVVNFKVIEP